MDPYEQRLSMMRERGLKEYSISQRVVSDEQIRPPTRRMHLKSHASSPLIRHTDFPSRFNVQIAHRRSMPKWEAKKSRNEVDWEWKESTINMP